MSTEEYWEETKNFIKNSYNQLFQFQIQQLYRNSQFFMCAFTLVHPIRIQHQSIILYNFISFHVNKYLYIALYVTTKSTHIITVIDVAKFEGKLQHLKALKVREANQLSVLEYPFKFSIKNINFSIFKHLISSLLCLGLWLQFFCPKPFFLCQPITPLVLCQCHNDIQCLKQVVAFNDCIVNEVYNVALSG